MPIRLAENFRAPFYAPYYATKALGFYEREGVDVELLNSAAPGDAVSGLLNGTIDITWAGPMRVMKARDDAVDSPLLCFCEVVTRDPFYLVGRPERSEFQLTDLPSLRFAAVSEVPTPWMCLQHDLRLQGVDPAKLVRAADRPMGDNFEALRNGQLDVIQVFEPYVSMALGEGIGDALLAASSRGPTVYTTFIATRGAIARHRDAFAAMTRAVGRMQTWLVDHGGEELAVIVAPFFPSIAKDILASSLQRYHQAGIWATTPEMSRQGFSRLADSLQSGGFVSRVPRYEDCVEQTLG
jgi:NitT/TauT family transport system substrate-binding protein